VCGVLSLSAGDRRRNSGWLDSFMLAFWAIEAKESSFHSIYFF
jgi:hypothetical protein